MVLLTSCSQLIITPIPNTIRFSNSYSDSNTICIPAAYTSVTGTIEGAYRINDSVYGSKTRTEYISITPTGLIIDHKWHGQNGFQQHVLVKNSKPRTFKPQKPFRRRALCSKDENYFIIESTLPMDLTEFAQLIAPYCDNAVNLDTGDYGYGWIGRDKRFRIFKYNKYKQTNWIIC